MDDIALRLWNARTSGGIVSYSPEERPTSEVEAYALQWRVTRLSGLPILGWKIGATNGPVQKQMGTTGPIYGTLQEGFIHASPGGSELFVTHDCHLETEVVFQLGADLPARQAPYSPDEVAAAVACVRPGFEIVGSRIEGGTKKSHAMTLIPDAAGQMGFVYGPPVEDWRGIDLAAERGRIYVNGELKGEGDGTLALGNPINVLAWLANELSAVEGAELKKGHFVSTGTVTGLTPIAPGDVCVGEFDHLGRVEFTFSRPAAS